MYLDIIKRDLRRKKTMNIILFLFLCLAVTFITASMNNLLSITNATGYFFDKAGIPDYLIVTIQNEKNDQKLHDFLEQSSQVKEFYEDRVMYIAGDEFFDQAGKKVELKGIGCISRINLYEQKFFSKENEIVNEVPAGCIYIPKKTMQNSNIKEGDRLTFRYDDYEKTYTVIGYLKDALFGSSLMGLERVVMSDQDYQEIMDQTDISMGTIVSVNPVDLSEFKKELNMQVIDMAVTADKNLIRMTYIFDIVMASVLLVVSICLILISLVILKFTIQFTMSEEYREIGIMKAIGIKNHKIRMLYLIKYCALSVISSVIGIIAGSMIGKVFLKEVSANMVMPGGNGAYLTSILCALAVIAIVLLFCYLCTRKVNKMSPLDAVRNGENGERFHNKNKLHLTKSKLRPSLFLAFNDIICGLKRYIGLFFIFFIGTELIIIPANSINTLSDGSLIEWFGMVPSDLYLNNESESMESMMMSKEQIEERLTKIQTTLQEHGIDAEVYTNVFYKVLIQKGDMQAVQFAQTNIGLPSSRYTMEKGSAPELVDEIAVTRVTADTIDAVIGDRVTIMINNEERTYLITGYFQSMNNLGEGVMFSEKENLSCMQSVGVSCIQVRYRNAISKEMSKEYRNTICELFPKYESYDGSEYLNKMLSGIAEQMAQIKNLIVAVILVINALVAVLMVKSFMTKETGDIAMMKAIGFSQGSIITRQTARIGIVLVTAIAAATALGGPLSQITAGRIFVMMGAESITFVIRPLEIYVIYPVIMLIVTVTASILTSLGVRRITSRQINCME